MVKSDLVIENVVTIKGNEPIILKDPNTVWVVKSGSLALFATLIDDEQQQGNRHYLFEVGSGEALFGGFLASQTSPEKQLGIMAVALEEAQLEQLAIEDLIKQLAAGNRESAILLDGWVKHLGKWITEQQTTLETVSHVVFVRGAHFAPAVTGQLLKPERNEVVWIDIRKGSTYWMGNDKLKLEQSSPVSPLAPGMWLEAETELEVYASSTAQLENFEVLPTSLAQLHACFFYYFNSLQKQKTEAQFHQFQEREHLNRQVSEVALGELAGVLQPQAADFFQEGTPLLIAAGAIGRALGMTIRPPARSEDVSRVKDPLDAIARASQFCTRRVLLVGEWWKQEYGPLLTYTVEEKNPIALLPHKGDRYIAFDPKSRSKTLVNKALAESLELEAYMFYRPLPQSISNILQIFRFASKGYEKDIALIFAFGIIGTLLGMITPQATAILVNDAIPDSDRLLLWQLGLALFAAALGKSAFQLAQGLISLRVENAADATLQPAVWNRMLNLMPTFFRKYSSGELLIRLLAVSQIRSQLSGATQRTLLSGIFALLNLGLMFIYSIKLALVAIGLTVVAVVVTIVSSRLLVNKQRVQEKLDGDINGLTVELIGGVAKLRVAAAEDRAFAAWSKIYSQRLKLQSGIQRINDSVSVFNEALTLISSVLLFWFAILFIQMNQATGGLTGLNTGTFLAFNSAFGIFLGGATDLSNTVTDILEIVPLWERAKPILDSKSEYDPAKADPGRLTGNLSLDFVTFRYREDGPLILDDVSIKANPGEFIAIVGPSGSGKSTIFRLLLGFETPLSGTVYYDGQDLAGLDIQAVRRQLGVVLQNVRISSGSIFDSISAGALVTLDEAWEAARMAGFAEDIEQMPMGMHTVVSEGGTNLSGGQRQRLLIARSLVLKPKIILMDEATSALDNRTQTIVTESLDRLNATRVVIAHRLSTIRNADRIYVVEAGRVMEVGTFEELVALKGIFAQLVARQLD
ncbi:MAG: NHLP bacteriocin export ABC transporter permease/ATPase subunit [Prochloraceae cyanobacterium]|nr:NHLP bacteriocin export ABC transporter permease/ATPase subunit [Prochloraceae cyanobacterium]